ncbi:MAG: GguC protein [Acidobacteria bacterium]|nr:GguC protein [Acidobacteriota bacterium]
MRTVQLRHPRRGRAVARVSGDVLELLQGATTVYGWAQQAIASRVPLRTLVADAAAAATLPYSVTWSGASEWTILPAMDHPVEAACCQVTGTGLTHMASAANRNAMHAAGDKLTDSMKMYQWGVEGGRPAPGQIGTSPEWFYKGNGTILVGHNHPLNVPAFAEDGGEEPEIAGVYLIDPQGNPRRIGLAQGNEFSDHVFEKKNYLYLASSKLRQCSLGPELVLDPDFGDVRGRVSVLRNGAVLWAKDIQTGQANMCHTLENMEHHHFKFPLHRRPGDVHIHYFGASAFSFGEQVMLRDADVMEVAWEGYGRALRNPLRVISGPAELTRVTPV